MDDPNTDCNDTARVHISQTNLVQWLLIPVGARCGTSVMSPGWLFEF
jgi:hypothetical protein